jgi:hypothetical protein
MVATMADDDTAPDRALAQELIGDLAERLNDTRPVMLLDAILLGFLTVGIAVEAALGPSPPRLGIVAVTAGLLLGCLNVCWLVAVSRLVLAGRPILGIVNDHRWKAGAPLDPRARWLHLPSIEATEDEWIWVRAHLLVGAARIRMERVQQALAWTLVAIALFLAWTALILLAG